MPAFRLASPVLALLLAGLAGAAQRSDLGPGRGLLRLEVGATTLLSNTVALPNDGASDRFSLRDLVGRDSGLQGRFTYERALGNGARGLRFVVVLQNDKGTGEFGSDTGIGGQTYAAGVPTTAFYRFNGYRGTYWWRVSEDARTLVRVGATVNVRDARVDVRQGGLRTLDSDVGFVPLAFAQLDHRFGPRLVGTVELDALAAPQGRVVDLGARVAYAFAPRLDLLLGARLFDGLGDVEGRVYNEARSVAITAGLAYRF